MFEDRRKLIIGGLITLFAIIIALILWWLFFRQAPPPVTVAPPTQPDAAGQAVQPAPLPPVSAQRIQEDKSYPLGLKQLAMAFTERFGSYSTDEPTKNMSDLEPLMTDRLKASIALQDNSANAGIFSGYSTKALSSSLISISGNSATVVVKAQRTQTLGTGEATKTYYADLELSAVRIGSEWKMDSAKWQ